MKKNVMPVAVAAALTATASHAAMFVNDKNTGEALIFPFYSAENGNNTLVNIVNTTGVEKAVKIRIIEGENSQEVLDFNVYFSAEDHFSFAISATEEGGGQLTTGDNTCTVPQIDGAIPFRNFAYLGDENSAEVAAYAAANPDASPGDTGYPVAYDNTGIGRTQVGYIEVIEMGQIDPSPTGTPVSDSVYDTTATGYVGMTVSDAVTHDSDGMPANCSMLVDAWSDLGATNGQWLTDAGTGGKGTSEFEASWAGGGLYGYATVINVPQGAAFGYDAVAIDNLIADGDDTGHALHYKPGDKEPNFLDTAITTDALVNTASGSVPIAMGGSYGPGVAQVQALNSMIMATEVMNDYVTDPAIAATTDWVLTFPTKTFHVAGLYDSTIEPFSERWNEQTACEDTWFTSIDREESNAPITPPGSSAPDFSPAPQSTDPDDPDRDLPLCFETNIIQFATESAAGNSSVAVGVNALLDANDGWATISFDPAELDETVYGDGLMDCSVDGATTTGACDRIIEDDNGVTMLGLPVVGFAAQKYVNGAAGGSGVLANYGMSTVHKTSVVISGN
jgi:hypothetical protein